MQRAEGKYPAEFKKDACPSPPHLTLRQVATLANRPVVMARNHKANPDKQVSADSIAPATQSGHTSKKKQHAKGKTTHMPTPPAPKPVSASSSKKASSTNVAWEGKHTDLLVDWILTHVADCHTLFHDRSSTATLPMLSPEDKRSGKNKKEISAVIVRHIFEHNPNYSASYVSEPVKYVTSVTNWLST